MEYSKYTAKDGLEPLLSPVNDNNNNHNHNSNPYNYSIYNPITSMNTYANTHINASPYHQSTNINNNGLHHSNSKRIIAKSLLSLNDFNEKYMNTMWFASFVIFFCYMFVCITVSHQWFGFSIVDSAYFVVITVATVGYGDFVPYTQGQRVFVVFMILFGLATASLLIGALNEIVWSHAERVNEERNIQTEQQLHSSMIRKRGRRRRSRATSSRANSTAPSYRTFSRSSALSKDTTAEEEYFVVKSGLSGLRIHVPVSVCVSEGPNCSIYERAPLTNGLLERVDSHLSVGEPVSMNKIELLYKDSFAMDAKLMRNGAIINCAVIVALVAIGALGIAMIEGWDWIIAMYWSTVTLATVGYGDFKPTTTGGRIFTTLYVLSASAFLARTLMSLVTYPLSLRSQQNEKNFLKQFSEGLTKEQLRGIFHSRMFDIVPGIQSKSDQLSKAEFTLLLLHLMNKVDLKQVMVASNLFDRLDRSETGILTFDNLSEEIRDAPTQAEVEAQRRVSIEADIDKSIQQISSKLSFSRYMSSGTGHDSAITDDIAETGSMLRGASSEVVTDGNDVSLGRFGYRRMSRSSSRASVDATI